jgi:hypothetical protein
MKMRRARFFAQFILSGQSEILRCAQDDSEGLRMTAGERFSAACQTGSARRGGFSLSLRLSLGHDAQRRTVNKPAAAGAPSSDQPRCQQGGGEPSALAAPGSGSGSLWFFVAAVYDRRLLIQ